MTSEQAIKKLRALADGAGYRYLELVVEGEVRSVTLEHVARPLWRVVGTSWADVLSKLAGDDSDAR